MHHSLWVFLFLPAQCSSLLNFVQWSLLSVCVKKLDIMGSSSSSNSGRNQDDREPELGDLIEIFRDNFQHWAVYVGAGFIVHFVIGSGGSSSSTSVQAVNGIVLKETLWNVVKRDKWRINNSLDKKYKPRPANVIVEDAKAMVDKELRYNLVSYNCEHFAKELRYGVAKSQQVETAATLGVVGGIVGGVMSGVPGGVLGSLAISGSLGSSRHSSF